jgi:hypothetical protein
MLTLTEWPGNKAEKMQLHEFHEHFFIDFAFKENFH